jgi:hypothetical protein
MPLSDFECRRSRWLLCIVSVLDAVNWIELAETVRKCFAKAGFGESGVADDLERPAVDSNSPSLQELCTQLRASTQNKFLCWKPQ